MTRRFWIGAVLSLPVFLVAMAHIFPGAPAWVDMMTTDRQATSLLRSMGFPDVSDLLGGYGAWAGAGLPVAHDAAGLEPRPTPEVGPTAAKAQLDGGAMLLDVRETVEWAAGHAPGASALPMRLVHEHHLELPRDRRILVICRTGGRSAAVTDALRGWGFDAVNVAGGMRAWAADGLGVVTDGGALGSVI
jgi:rhodanese-related sulfurtransferase